MWRKRYVPIVTAAILTVCGGAGPAMAGSQCFKNLDDRPLYITLRYRNGDRMVMRLYPGEKRRFDNVRGGDFYCYSFRPIEDDCPNRKPVHLTSCSNPRLQ